MEVFSRDDRLLSHVGALSTATAQLDDVCVLAIKATDTDLRRGLISSTSTGVVTDSSWRCIDHVPDDVTWRRFDFDDSDWPFATITGSNGDEPWGVIADVSSDAKWIWGNASDEGVLYCRKTICVGKICNFSKNKTVRGTNKRLLCVTRRLLSG